MHELGVVFHVIRTVEEVARENALTEIRSVTLELGEVSAVIDTYLENCWKWAVANRTEIMKEAELIIEKLPAVTYCGDCRKTYETVAYGKICPYCGSGHTWLLQGNEFTIKEIEGC